MSGEANKPKRPLPWLPVAITVGALAIFLGRIYLPHWHERVDLISLGILVFAVLPWLSSLVSEISVAGVFAAKMRAVEETAQEAKMAAKDAQQQVELEAGPTPEAAPTFGETTGASPADHLFALGAQYVSVRAGMPSGDNRTAEMTRIFREMMAGSRALGPHSPAMVEALGSGDAGHVLAAIAHAYEHPGAAKVGPLLDAVGRTAQPFVQYWGLMALRKLTRVQGIRPWALAEVAALKTLGAGLRDGTDRAWVYRQVLDMLESGQ